MGKMALQIAVVATLVVVAQAGSADAASAVLNKTCVWLSSIAKWLIGVSYVVGTIGVAFVSIKASATGKFSSGGFLAIMMGLFLVSSIPALTSFLVDGTFTWTCKAPG